MSVRSSFPAVRTLLAAATLACCGVAQATAISSYDITNTPLSGYGNWSHTYNGTISGNDYSGGSGTLNDGVIPTDHQNNHLFNIGDGTTITLHLDAMATIASIYLLGGSPGNFIPGTLTGWSVTIGGNTVAFASTDIGGSCTTGPCDDRVDLMGSGLENLATTTLTLSNFTGGWQGYFNIGEIELSSDAASAVPEPAGIALTLIALGAAAAAGRRRRPSKI